MHSVSLKYKGLCLLSWPSLLWFGLAKCASVPRRALGLQMLVVGGSRFFLSLSLSLSLSSLLLPLSAVMRRNEFARHMHI